MSRQTRSLAVIASLAAALVLVIGAAFFVQPRQLDPVPTELSAAALISPDQLGQWCVDRKAAGTVGLSSRAKAWLTDCIALFGAGLTPSPTVSPSPSPTGTPGPSLTPPPTPSSTTPAPSPSSTSPAPSPTPTTGPPVGCLSRLAACGYPDAANTGVPGGTALTIVSGNVTLSTAGMVYEGKDVRGCIQITAPNVTIRNSRIASDSNCDYIRIRSLSTGLALTDVEVSCADDYGIAIGSSGFTATRLNIHNCENGFDVSAPGNAVVRDSYIHDLWSGGGAHTDGMQVGEGASNITVQHNVIYNAADQTSAIILWNEAGSQNNDVLVTANLLAGGGWTVYCGRFGTSVNVVFTNNRFAAGQYGPSDSCVPPHVSAWSGNVVDATGAVLSAA